MSLRGSPVVEHATLPGGGTITIWVGVPDDPYIDDKRQLTTVDIQLHEGNAVVASLSTVLEPEQTSEAVQLAREVKAAIEAGEIGLHANGDASVTPRSVGAPRRAVERVAGIEPAWPAWKAGALPLSYTRVRRLG
jgi:hypothetical protein